MNKKVLTLCAGLLLAGGAFGTANAAISASAKKAAKELTTNEKWVVDYGKYFVLERTAHFTGNSWGSTGTDKYFLTVNKDGKLVYTTKSNLKDKSAYWTIEDVTPTNDPKIDGTTYVAKVKVINAEGLTLAFDKSKADANGNLKVATEKTKAKDRVEEFYVLAGFTRTPSTLTVEGELCLFDNTTQQEYRLGNIATELVAGSDEYEAVAVKLNGTTGTYSVTGASINDVNAVGILEEALQAKELNAQLNGGFELNFTSNGEAYKNLTQAEAFAGKLTAIGTNLTTVKDWADADKVAASTTDSYYFRTSDGRYIVLDDEFLGEKNSTLAGTKSALYRGYNFKTVSEHEFANMTDKSNATFKVFRSYDFNNTDSLIISLPNVKKIGSIDKNGLNVGIPNNESGLRLYIATVNVAGVQSDVLTTIAYTKANDMLAKPKDDQYNNSQIGAWAPHIAFGSSNIVNWNKFAGKVWNITNEDGYVLSPKSDGDIDWSETPDNIYAQLFAPANEVDLTNPEGQWLLDDAGNCFVNRESGEQAIEASKNWVIRDLGNNKYALYNSKFDTKAEHTIYIREAKNAELGWTENGYVKFDMDEEQNNGKYLSFESTLGTVYVGKDADDNVVLTTDASEAIEFRVKLMEHNFKDHGGVQAPDTLQHYTSFMNVDKDGELFVDVDTLQFFQYALYENFSEKYLMYNTKTKKFQLSKDSWTSNAHENFDQEGNKYAFVVKAREDGSYIWVRDYAIDYDYCNSDANHKIQDNWNGEKATFDNIFEVNFGQDALTVLDKKGNSVRVEAANGQAHKLYAGIQKDGFLADMADIYNYNDNDRVTMEPTNKVEYMKFNADLDTVKISLQSKPNFFLYEHNVNGTNFLSMEHVADVEDMKAAIFVDTAYVRGGTDRPQYLLAVGAKHVDEIWDSHDDKDPVHLLHADTTYGRFLVNMVDSAKVWKGSVKTNPYIYEELNDNYYYRLAFIDGYHTGDALYLNTEGAKTKINLGNNNEKVCTFSFRYVDEDREGVKIETTYDGKTRGWLKYQNNVPVVTNDYKDAHVFLVDNTTLDAPTANETIAAEGTISVVATDGAVIIKGAEGKNVVIATILGKVVANETVNSDNETIAVPAGIAVVSVDGESFKVVVK